MRDRTVSCPWGALASAALVAVTACQTPDPNAAALAKLNEKDPVVVVEGLSELRRNKVKQAIPQILVLLKSEDGSIREGAAAALEDLGDAQVVGPLTEAIDLSSSDKNIARANMKIADALGTIGSTTATPTVLKLLHSRDDMLRFHAAQALDKLKDPKATKDLIDIASDKTVATLVAKYAIIALGDMQATDALETLAKDLVQERSGVSFFVESSYALFQIGAPAVPTLTGLIDGSDKKYAEWAESENRLPAGYASKAAIVLADIGDPSSIPVLVKALSWKDPNDNAVYANLVRGKAAEALGRLRAKEAAAPLAASLASIDDANMRALFAMALAHIDDKSVIPKMEAAIKNPKEKWPRREETIGGLAMFADNKEKPLFEAVQKQETAEFAVKECMADETEETPEAKDARCKKDGAERVKYMVDALALLQAGDDCKDDAKCWIGKLKDPNQKIRERAAYTLGKIATPDVVDPLLAAGKDQVTQVRRAAYIALDWLTRVDGVKSVLKTKGDQLAKQYEDEKSSAILMIVNEDLKRVVWKVQHI